MQVIHIEPDVFIRLMVSRAFPNYKGKQFKLAVSDSPINCASYWEGGSRSFFVFANLATGEVSNSVPAQSAFDRPVSGLDAVSLPDGFVCLEHTISCGKDCGITIHIRTSNAAPLLPAQVELSKQENIVLAYTRCLKSSYNGIPSYRFHEAHLETGISQTEWDVAKATLIDRGLMTKQGALTVAGRNAAKGDLYQFRKAS